MRAESTDQRHVSGCPLLRRGFVVGERYQVERRLTVDALSATYLCRDQEDGRAALVRVMNSRLIGADGLRAYVDQVGSTQLANTPQPHLLPIVDADLHESPSLVTAYFATHAPAGERLEAILALEGRLPAEIVLDYLVDISSALTEIPEGNHHGDVRAEHIMITPAGARLGGGFAIACAPKQSLAALLRQDQTLRAAFAPEVLTGAARDAADRYQFGLLAHRMLVGGPTPEAGATMPPELGAVGDAINELLAPHPRKRAVSTAPLLEALSRQTGRLLPGVACGSGFPPKGPDVNVHVNDDEVTRSGRPGTPETAAQRSRAGKMDIHRPAVADPEGTAELSLDQLYAMAAGAGEEPEAEPLASPVQATQQASRDELTLEGEPGEHAPEAAGDLQATMNRPPTASAEPPHENAGAYAGLDETPEEVDEPTTQIAVADIQPADASPRVSSASDVDTDSSVALQRGIDALPKRDLDPTERIRHDLPVTQVTRRPTLDHAPPTRYRAQGGRPRRFKKRYVFAIALVLSILIIGASLVYRWMEMSQARQEREQRIRDRMEQLRAQ